MMGVQGRKRESQASHVNCKNSRAQCFEQSFFLFNNMLQTQTQIIPEENINNKFQAVVNYEQ